MTKTLDELRDQELLPFQAGIDAGADMVMVGHIIVTDVDDVPALFSYTLLTEVLRGEMGFEGVIVSDALEMQALTQYYEEDEIVVLAIQAGADMLLCPTDLNAAVNAILRATEAGELSVERIDDSVLRILALKDHLGLLSEG